MTWDDSGLPGQGDGEGLPARGSRKFPPALQRQAQRKLVILDGAEALQDLRIPPGNRLEKLHGKRNITADTARRLSRFFGTSERFWLNLQTRYDLEVEKDRLGDRLETEIIQYAHAS